MTWPVPLTSFIGREREVATVTQMLTESRLVTLTGAAGSGKTRLAIAVAQRAGGVFGDGAAWVDLSILADPDLLPACAAAQIDVREETGRPPLETLCDNLRERPVLLVLDNCEHLADATARLVETLLRECPLVRILATSREALSIGGERAWLVPLLAADDAVTLFVERAQALVPLFHLTPDNAAAVEAICRRLDGLPLAIELAAARMPVLAPTQLLARLDEGLRSLGSGSRTAPPRQRTLRGAIDWSYGLLAERERLLLARLSVFSGVFSLTAVERVCADAHLPVEEILDPLSALVEKSLVMMELREGEARYRLLEMVRRYAQERLAASGEEVAVRDRHAAFYLEMAEESEEQLLGYGAPAWIAALDEATPSLRVAFDWCVSAPQRVEGALRIARALYRFWYVTAQFAEGRARLSAALERSPHVAPRARARALTALGFLAMSHGDYPAARASLTESVTVLRGLDDAAASAFALLCLGVCELLAGDAVGAESLLVEAVEKARASGRPTLTAQTLYWRSSAARRRGDPRVAVSALEEAVALTRRPGSEYVFAYCVARLGVLRNLGGDPASAVACLREALAIQHIARGRWSTAQILDGLAGVAVSLRRADRAARLLGAAEAICRQMDATAPLDVREFHDEFAAAARAALGDAAYERARAEGAALDLEGALEEAAAVAETPRMEGPAAVPAPEPAPPTPPAPMAGPALRVLALGPLEIRRDGSTVPLTAWRAARPRELLLYLLCHRAGRTRDQIALAFWPDAAPAQIKNNFHVALHYLRKALGRADLVLFDRERYRVNWELGVEFDAAEFEAAVGAALRHDPADFPADALRDALARYRGDFLEDAGVGDWHLEPRDHLRRLYVDGLLALGAHEESASRFAEAAETYRRILRVDPLDEAASRCVMRCHARLGERAEALREFERLARALRSELDVEPDAQTRALAERIKRAESI